MSDQDYNYPPPSFGQNYGGQQNNYDNDYQSNSDRGDSYSRGGGGGYNKGGNFGNRNNRGGFNKGDNMVVQDDTVFVSGMDPDVSETDINDHFGAIGIIKKDRRTNKPKIWIYRDKESGLGKGECTITYDDPAAAQGAIQWFDGKEFNGNVIKVQLAQRNNTWQKGGLGGAPRKSFGSGGGRGGSFGSGGPPRDDRNSRNFGGSNGGGRSGGGSGGGQHRDGDWICSDCSNKNFAWRNECNRCQAPKSDDGNGSSRGSGGNGGGGGGGRFQSRNDGGNRNFSRGGMRGGDRSSGGFNRQRPY